MRFLVASVVARNLGFRHHRKRVSLFCHRGNGFRRFAIIKPCRTAGMPPSAPPPSPPFAPSPPSTELQHRPVSGRAAAHGFPRVLDFWRQEPAPPRTPWTARPQRARPPQRHARGGSRVGWRNLDRHVSGGGALKVAPAVGGATSTGAAERRVRGGGGLVELGLDAGPQGPDGGGARGRRWRLPWP